MRQAMTRVDGSGASDAFGRAVGEFLDLAAGLEDAVPILDAPAPGIVFDDPATVLGGVYGERGKQHPLDRGDALGRALLFHEYRLQAHRRLVPVGAVGGCEFDTAGAHHQRCAALRPARSFRALAAFRARGQPVDQDHGPGTGGCRAQGFQQRGSAGNPAPALGAHQQFRLGSGALFLEQCEDVRLPVHYANHLGASEIPSLIRTVPKALDPAGAFATLRSRFALRRWCLETGP